MHLAFQIITWLRRDFSLYISLVFLTILTYKGLQIQWRETEKQLRALHLFISICILINMDVFHIH